MKTFLQLSDLCRIHLVGQVDADRRAAHPRQREHDYRYANNKKRKDE